MSNDAGKVLNDEEALGELNVMTDEVYELLRLKLEEKLAREEVELLDELVLLQSMQTRLAKGKVLDASWRDNLIGWIERHMRRRRLSLNS